MNTDYDVIVLGGGSAGTKAASVASAAGARTLMINDGELGGLCILRGCMPTKALLHCAELYEEMRHLEPLGLAVEGRSFDFPKIMARKAAKVARFKRAKLAGIERSAYEVLDARARFVGPDCVEAGGQRYRAGRGYVLATGSVPHRLPIPGLDSIEVMSSDEVMRLETLPRSLVVQGAGPIGLELAWFFARFGVEVTLVNRSPLLSKVDAEFTPLVSAAFLEHPGSALHVGASIERVAPCDGGIRFSLEVDGEAREVVAERFLSAVGRTANLAGLGLEAAGIAVEGGKVVHDAGMRTSNERVWVAGDATGSYQILHLANQEGAVAGANAVGGNEEQDYRLKMEVIFTDPPFASVGLTEPEARALGLELAVARKNFAEQGRGIVMETRHGRAKLLADKASGELVGCQIFGPRADDMIHVAAALMHFRGSFRDIAAMPWYHPTLTESFIELGRQLAAQC